MLDRKAIQELLELMEALGQPIPDYIPLNPRNDVVQDVREMLEAQRERKSLTQSLFGPSVKKSDFLKTTAIPTGLAPKPVPPFKPINLRRVTNAIDLSIKKATHRTVTDEFSYYYPREW